MDSVNHGERKIVENELEVTNVDFDFESDSTFNEFIEKFEFEFELE